MSVRCNGHINVSRVVLCDTDALIFQACLVFYPRIASEHVIILLIILHYTAKPHAPLKTKHPNKHIWLINYSIYFNFWSPNKVTLCHEFQLSQVVTKEYRRNWIMFLLTGILCSVSNLLVNTSAATNCRHSSIQTVSLRFIPIIMPPTSSIPKYKAPQNTRRPLICWSTMCNFDHDLHLQYVHKISI